MSTAKKSNRKHKGLMIAGFIFLISLTVYLGIAVFFSKHFLPGTTINGVSASGKTIKAVERLITEEIDGYQIELEHRKILPLRKGRKFQEIDITEELVELYENYMLERKKIYLEEEAEEIVFVSVTGKIIATKDCNKTIAKYCNRANIKVVTCHDLRHTCATTLMKRGANLEDVSSLLGHKSLTTTSRYIHGQASNVSKFMGL